jgi:chondroitin AC lyase
MVFDESHILPLTDENASRPPSHPESTEKGRKAWFFFDGEMVALGAGITATRDEPMGTSINQTLLHGPVLIDGHAAGPGESKVSQGSWVLHDEIGYTLLGPAAASLTAGPQTGDWKSVASTNSDAPITEQIFSMWIDHGVRPRDAEYAYAVVPATNARQLAEWVAHPPVRVISNTPALQAVINEKLGVAEIVFHSPGSVKLTEEWAVKTDHPCLAMLVKHGNATSVSVSSPGGEFFTVHLTLTTRQKEKMLTFELPDGDRAGKTQTIEVSDSLAGVYSPSPRPGGN